MNLAPRDRGPTEFEVHASSNQNGCAIHPRGELDLATCDRLAEVLHEALHSAAGDPVVLDLSGLEFMDSSGLRTIVAANRTATKQGRQFVIRRGPRAVQRIFEISGMEQMLPFVD